MNGNGGQHSYGCSVTNELSQRKLMVSPDIEISEVEYEDVVSCSTSGSDIAPVGNLLMTHYTDNISDDRSTIYDVLPTTATEDSKTTGKTSSVYKLNEVDHSSSVIGRRNDTFSDAKTSVYDFPESRPVECSILPIATRGDYSYSLGDDSVVTRGAAPAAIPSAHKADTIGSHGLKSIVKSLYVSRDSHQRVARTSGACSDDPETVAKTSSVDNVHEVQPVECSTFWSQGKEITVRHMTMIVLLIQTFSYLIYRWQTVLIRAMIAVMRFPM